MSKFFFENKAYMYETNIVSVDFLEIQDDRTSYTVKK